jgi:hypothetical protein
MKGTGEGEKGVCVQETGRLVVGVQEQPSRFQRK